MQCDISTCVSLWLWAASGRPDWSWSQRDHLYQWSYRIEQHGHKGLSLFSFSIVDSDDPPLSFASFQFIVNILVWTNRSFAVSSEMTANVIGQLVNTLFGVEKSHPSSTFMLKGVARFYQAKKRHVITTQTEHKCVLDSCRVLEAEGFDVTYLPVQKNGLVDLEVHSLNGKRDQRCSGNALMSIFRNVGLLYSGIGGFHSSWHLFGISDDCEQWDWSQTAHHWDRFVFQLLWASRYLTNIFEPVVQLPVSCSLHLRWLAFFVLKGCNIISFLSPGRICRSKGVFLHTDAAQAVGKIPINVSDWRVDLMSISGHKIYGPKG